jgi:hypothetical protein
LIRLRHDAITVRKAVSNLENSILNRERRIVNSFSKDIVGYELLFNQSDVNVPKEVIRESINANETTEDAHRI